MTTDEKRIAPALSAEEWAERRGVYPDYDNAPAGRAYINPLDDLVVTFDSGAASETVPPEEIPGVLALANAALPDDSPYKITAEDVFNAEECEANLRAFVTAGKAGGFLSDQLLEYCAGVERLVAKLRALLPPE